MALSKDAVKALSIVRSKMDKIDFILKYHRDDYSSDALRHFESEWNLYQRLEKELFYGFIRQD